MAAVGAWADIAPRGAGAATVDLSRMTVLPGLIDAHTHLLLQGDITAAEYDEQLLKESIPYRTIRAVAAGRVALMHGFTTLRDLETEGAMFADVDLKRAFARDIVPGPRLFVATRAFSATGMYPLSGYSWELKVPDGVQIVDGPEEIRKGVREQVKYGADWIKVYVDRRYYLGEDGRLRSWVNFTDEELKMFVDEAHRLGKRAAAHAIGWDGIDAALRAGFNSIEHGDGLTPDLMDRMVKQGVFWCPTIFVGAYVAEGRGGIWPRMVEIERIAFGAGAEARGTDRVRHRRRGVCLDGTPGQGDVLYGAIRHDPDAGHPLGHLGRRRPAGAEPEPGKRGPRAVGGLDRPARGPARRHQRAGARDVGDEGGGGRYSESMKG